MLKVIHFAVAAETMIRVSGSNMLSKGIEMMKALLNFFFGCTHARTSFPLTPARRAPGGARTGMYVSCLDCGKEFRYDWQNMRVGEPVSPRLTQAVANEPLATQPVETWK
jgi:hypothetical protein